MGTHFKDSPPKTTEEAVAHVEKRDIAHRTGKQAKVTPHVDEELYKKMYDESINEPEKFWDKVRPPFSASWKKSHSHRFQDGQGHYRLAQTLQHCPIRWL
jgi:hypothetical protein